MFEINLKEELNPGSQSHHLVIPTGSVTSTVSLTRVSRDEAQRSIFSKVPMGFCAAEVQHCSRSKETTHIARLSHPLINIKVPLSS